MLKIFLLLLVISCKIVYNDAERKETIMDAKEQCEIFSANLKRYIKDGGYTQIEVAKAIGVNPQALNYWCSGRNLPRMDKVQKLADFFGIRKSDLVDRHDEVTEETIYDILERREDLRDLLYVAVGLSKDNLQLLIKIARLMK